MTERNYRSLVARYKATLSLRTKRICRLFFKTIRLIAEKSFVFWRGGTAVDQ